MRGHACEAEFDRHEFTCVHKLNAFAELAFFKTAAVRDAEVAVVKDFQAFDAVDSVDGWAFANTSPLPI